MREHIQGINNNSKIITQLSNEVLNAVDELKHSYKPAPAHKVEAIKDALKHLGVYE